MEIPGGGATPTLYIVYTNGRWGNVFFFPDGTHKHAYFGATRRGVEPLQGVNGKDSFYYIKTRKWVKDGIVQSWNPGEPDNYAGKEDCMEYCTGRKFNWNDLA